jgi:CheY-like chemotaxis protein
MARILVADDAAMVRLIVCRSLKEHETQAAADGQQALERLREWQPDIAILDWMMPGLTGLEVCQAARSDPSIAGTIFVMMTARSDLAAEQQARSAGIDHFIRKPVMPRQLDNLVERLLSNPGLTRQVSSEHARPVSLRFKVKSDVSRNRLMIRASGRPTEADLSAIMAQVGRELLHLAPGYVVWIDLRGTTFVDQAIYLPLEQLYALVVSQSPSKVGTLLDDLTVRMQVTRIGGRAGIHTLEKQFTDEQAWQRFLSQRM